MAAAAWAALGVDLVTHVLSGEAAAVLRNGALAVTVLAGLARHAKRMEAAMREHVAAMREHVLTVERLFKIGVRADEAASMDAVRAHMAVTGTGPFRIYPGGK